MNPFFFWLFVFSLFAAIHGHAQSMSDQITVKEKNLTTEYYLEGRLLTAKQLKLELSKVPEADGLFHRSKTHQTVSIIAGGAGGFLLGYELVGVLSGNDVNWSVIGIGAGLMAVSIPFSIRSKVLLKESIYAYNQSPGRRSSSVLKLKVWVSVSNGAGLTLTF